MSGGVAVVQYDTDPLIQGTQRGPSGTTIIESGKDFYSCGARSGLALKNVSRGTSGNIISVNENQIVSDITFYNGDLYSIYITDTYNSKISRIFTDRRFGRKTDNPANLVNGLFPDDIDVDENQRHVFGPGEPWETKA